MDDQIESLQKKIDEINENKPKFNAGFIGNIPIDTSYKKQGWGFLYNDKTGKLEMFPIGIDNFYDHNKLKNYDEKEHRTIKDKEITKKGLWSSSKISQEIAATAARLKTESLRFTGGLDGGSFTDSEPAELITDGGTF